MNKILITGSQGFLGSALKRKIIASGLPVLELDAVHGDISNETVFDHYKDEDISHLFHLAGKTFVPDSWERPSEFYRTNVMGTANVLEFCRKKRIALTYVSAYIYGHPECLPIPEKHPIAPNNPYAHSKYLAEQLCEFHAKHFKIKITILRPFNIYGVGQNKLFLIPHIVHQALYEDVIKVKDLLPKRDYVYLDDVVEALILTRNAAVDFSVYNIGAGYSLSVQEIIETVQKILGTNKPIKSENIVRQNELADVIADISRARHELQWQPRYSFHDGIKKILENERKDQ